MPSARRLALPAALLLAAALPGCNAGAPERPAGGTETVAARNAPADFSTGYPVEPGHAAELGYDVKWVHDLALDAGQRVTDVVVEGGLAVVIEEPVNLITALELNTGRTLWKSVVGSRLDSVLGATVDDTDVFVNTPNRLYRLARRSGTVKEIQELEYVTSGSPLRLGRRALFGSDQGVLFAHHLDDGYTKWAFALQAPIRVRPVLGDGQVFTVDTEGNYAMLGTNAGRLRWRGRTYGPVTAQVALHDGFVLVASEDQSFYSLSEVTGKDRWPVYRSEARLTTGPLPVGQTAYLHEPGRGLTAVALDSGTGRWFYPGDVQPLTADDRGVLVAGDGVLVALDAATGEPRHAVPTRDLADVRTAERGLLLLSRTGRLMGLTPIDAAPDTERTAATR